MSDQGPSLTELTEKLLAFRDARDWRQFHSLKDLVVSTSLEAAELLEISQWKSDERFERHAQTAEGRARLAEECADVLLYLLLIAERAGFDLAVAAENKIVANEAKYPVEKAKGNAKKYNELPD